MLHRFSFLKHLFILVLLFGLPMRFGWAQPVTRLACVGDSLTISHGDSNPELDCYPARLASLLGESWEVRKFGVSGATVIKYGTNPYIRHPEYQQALAYKPDVVVIGLGTNDTRPPNFPSRPNDFEPCYLDLIASFRQANPAVRVYVCLPPPLVTGVTVFSESVLVNGIIPAIRNVAAQTGASVIDVHTALVGKGYCFPDFIHPNELGALYIARAVYQGLTGLEPPPIYKSAQGLSILPLGDSLTLGTADPFSNGGYRDPLYQLLQNSGASTQFVGSAITGASTTLRAAGQDFHEGHPGYYLSNLLNNFEANRADPPKSNSNGGHWFNGGRNTERGSLYPDVVLLLAGINDIVGRSQLGPMQQRMTTLLNWFATNRPSSRVFVGTLVPYDDSVNKTVGYNDRVRAFNAWLTATVAARDSGRLILVDHYSLFVDQSGAIKTQDSSDGIYLTDGMHPSPEGYKAMAEAWFKAMHPLLDGPEVPSLVVTSTEDTTDKYDDRTTLREAILYANTLTEVPTPAAGDTPEPTPTGPPIITFDPVLFKGHRLITLNGTPLPNITTSMVIESRRGVTLDAGGKSTIIQTSAPDVTLRGFTFANGIDGAVQNTTGSLRIEGSAFVGNAQAVTTGSGTTLSLVNCTLSGNEVGITSQEGATVTLAHSTVAGNAIGLHSEGTSTFNVSHSIVTNNSQLNSDAPFASNTFNIIGTDAGLDPEGLKNNGGSTDTIALLLGSPAINAGLSGSGSAEATDQRGESFARVRSGAVDIGAFEVQNLPPVARDDSFSTSEDIVLSRDAQSGLLANDSDPDGIDTLRLKVVVAPRNGKVSLGALGAFTYSPYSNWSGTDSFTYLVSDGRFSAQATATIKVLPVNDAPTAKVSVAPLYPTTNTVLKATAVGTDIEDQTVSFTYQWKKGDLVLARERSSTLDLSKLGNGDKGERITVVVTPNDGQVVGTPATASVTVINSPPTLAAATFLGRENQKLTGQLKGQDADREVLTYSLVKAPRVGSLQLQSNGIFTYSPKSNWNGTDTFQARVSDSSGATVTALFSVSIAAVNGAPVAVADVASGLEDVPLSISAATLLRNDLNGENSDEVDALRIVRVSVPAGFPGTVRFDVVKQTILFTPKLNWNGTTSFSYTVQDSGGAIATAQVTLRIAPVNDAPVALPGRMATVGATPGELPLTGTDVEGDALTFSLNAKPANGTAMVVKVDGQWLVRYQSKVGFIGTDTIPVTAHDGKLNSVPATITVTVRANSAPQLVSLLPNRGSFPAGSTVVFEQKVRDANGTAHLDATALLVSNFPTALDARGGATLWFDAVENRFTLTKDDGVTSFAPVALGGTLENSQVKVTLGTSDVARDNFGVLTLRWQIAFKSNFLGTKSLWSRAEDLGGLSAGFAKSGDITLTTPAPQAPSNPSAPSS